MAKSMPESDEITEISNQIIHNLLDATFDQCERSQNIHQNLQEPPVKVLTDDNFNSVVFDVDKDVLVDFYAPWCGICMQLVPLYEELGEYFRKSDKIIIAKIDVSDNEIENVELTSLPTIRLYTKSENKVIEYKGPRTLESFIEFVESGGVVTAAIDHPP